MGGGGERRIHGFCHQVTAERADPFTAHGVALVGHGGRTDLAVLEGFFKLPVVLQEADVLCHAVTTLGNGTQGVQDAGIGLAGIGLATDRETGLKPEFRSQQLIHTVDLLPVAVKEIQKARFGSGGTAAAEETETVQNKVQLLQIGNQVLHPERGPFPDGDQLCGLVVGISQRWQRLIPICKVRQNSQQ